MKRFFAFWSILFVIGIISSCEKSTDKTDIAVFITGTVWDKVSRKTIDSAWIDTQEWFYEGQPLAFSDSLGNYTIDFFIGSNQLKRIYAGKTGYLTFDTLVQLSTSQTGCDTVNIYLEPE